MEQPVYPIPEIWSVDDLACVPFSGTPEWYMREDDDWIRCQAPTGDTHLLDELGASLTRDTAFTREWVDYIWDNGWDGFLIPRTARPGRGPLESLSHSADVMPVELATHIWRHAVLNALGHQPPDHDHVLHDVALPALNRHTGQHRQDVPAMEL